VRGFRDASKVQTGTMAKRQLDEQYGGTRLDFQSGYVQGLRDAGLTGLSQSMHNLAGKHPGGGYSAGYMQVSARASRQASSTWVLPKNQFALPL